MYIYIYIYNHIYIHTYTYKNRSPCFMVLCSNVPKFISISYQFPCLFFFFSHACPVLHMARICQASLPPRPLEKVVPWWDFSSFSQHFGEWDGIMIEKTFWLEPKVAEFWGMTSNIGRFRLIGIPKYTVFQQSAGWAGATDRCLYSRWMHLY